MKGMGSLKKVVIYFFQRDGVMYIAMTLVGEKGQVYEETECDAQQITWNVDTHESTKTDLN